MSGQKRSLQLRQNGFTIVELLVVIVVIAVLAAITIVTYNGVNRRAAVASLQSDLNQNATTLSVNKVDSGSYPLTNDITPSTYFKHAADTTLEYSSADGTSFCLTASSNTARDNYYFDSIIGKTQQGKCTGHIGYIASGSPLIQTITSASCPSSRTRVADARDSHTYWIQKIGGTCWMLTNLAYAGGGTNTYNDVVSLTDGTGGATNFLTANYYVVPSTVNYTTDPADPSASNTGTGQYGYLYNFCGANGGQTGNGACSNLTGTAVNTSISACPAGWRLPTGNGGEFGTLNTTVNGGSTTTDAGLVSGWLAQRAGIWNSSFTNQGTYIDYWASNQASSTTAYRLYGGVSSASATSSATKTYGYAVRCVAI